MDKKYFKIYPGQHGVLDRPYFIQKWYYPKEYLTCPIKQKTHYDYAIFKLTEMVDTSNFIPLNPYYRE